MLNIFKALFHQHTFTYRSANGDRTTAEAYEARERYVTRRCPCGDSGHNIGYTPPPASFDLEELADWVA